MQAKKQTRDAEATKAAFIAAAETLFSRHGFAGTTLDMLAAETSANKALVSYYFGSKEGLYDQVIAAVVGAVLGDLARLLRANADPEKNFRAYIRALAHALGRHASFPALLMREYIEGSMQEREAPFREVAQFFRLTKEHYDAGYRAKLFRKVDPHLLHLSIIGPLSHFIIAARARAPARSI
ncbi:MAG: TetR/AcrR family transcriptional regulator [Parvularculaceae bacterium]